MDVVWSAGRAVTVREIRDHIGREPHPAYNTVLTVTEILHRRGWLHRAKHGKAFRYWATAGRDDYTERLMHEALDSTDDRAAALVRFMEGMGPAEMAEIRRALDATADTAGGPLRATAGAPAGGA